MALSDAVAAIRSRAESLWPGLEPLVPLSWPNEQFDKPVDGDSKPLPFLLIELRWNGGEFLSVGAPGNNIARRDGHVWCFAFIPQGTGEARAHELVGKAAGMFEGQDFSGLVCEAAMPGGQADSEDGAYFGQTAAVPFQFDEEA